MRSDLAGEVEGRRCVMKVEYVRTEEHGGVHWRGEEEEKFKVGEAS